MAGIGQSDVEPLSAGTTAQPLVSPMNPAVTPDAVTALVDAFRKGAIGAADIQDRIGAEAMANKRAHIQQLSEYVSPEAINSRLAQIQATGAEAQLKTAQATAGEQLVQPIAQKSLQDIIQANETRYSAPAVQAYTQFNPPIYKVDRDGNPTGEYDVQAMSREGARYVRAQSMLALAADGLKSAPVKMVNPKTGAPVDVWLNSKGEDVTPVAGNKAYEFYSQMRRDAYDVFHEKPNATPHFEPVEGGPAAPKYNAPSGIIETPGATPNPPVDAAPTVTPAASQGAAAADPTVTPAGPSYMPYQGLQTGPAQTPAEATKAFEEKPDVKAFYTSLPVYTGFADASRQAVQQPSAVSDLALAESYSKLFDPQSTLREFKFEALQKAIPWLSKFRDAPAIIARTHMFPPEVRNAIARSGLDVINTREKSLVPRLQEAAKEGAMLNQEQQQILNGVPFSQRQGLDTFLPPSGTSATGAGTSKTVTLSNGRTVQVQY